MKNVVVVTQFSCLHCDRVKTSLYDNSIKYEEISLNKSQGPMRHFLKASGITKVPAVFIQGSYIGGADDVDRLLKLAKLRSKALDDIAELDAEEVLNGK